MDTSDYVGSSAIYGQYICHVDFQRREAAIRLKREPEDPKRLHEAFKEILSPPHTLFWCWGIRGKHDAAALPFGAFQFSLVRAWHNTIKPSRPRVASLVLWLRRRGRSAVFYLGP